MQGCRRLTSGFSFGGSSEVRVSRVFFSGPYQSCTRMRMQDVRGEMWPGAAVPRRPARRCRPPSQSCVCTHRACVRTALINEISTGTAPEVVPGLLPWHRASGDLGALSALAGSAHGLGRCNPEPSGRRSGLAWLAFGALLRTRVSTDGRESLGTTFNLWYMISR